MKIISSLFILFIVSFSSLSHEIREDSKLVTLSDDNFTRIYRANSNGIMFVMFYSPGCGHCVRAMPEWQDFADEMDGKIIVGAIDCTKNDFTRARFEVNSYPTFYMIKEEKIYQYEGLRTVAEWTKFVEEGHTYKQGRGLPSLPPTDWDKAFAPIKEIWNQLKYLITNKPGVFFGMIGIVLFMTIFTVYITSWLAGKMSQIDEMEKEASKYEQIANQSESSAAPVSGETKSETKEKPKKVGSHAKRE